MVNSDLIRILVKGGILTPGYFLKIAETAKKNGNSTLKFGSRQDILFEVSKSKKKETEEAMNSAGIDFEWKGIKELRKQNIVTSFVTSGILNSTNWVTEGTYLKILEEFKYAPQIKVNIVDAKQNLQPLFNGTLNFISSETEDYWYFYINYDGELSEISFLVNSLEIPIVAKFCEMQLLQNKNLSSEKLVTLIETKLQIKKSKLLEKLKLPTGLFPCYEGIEKMQNGKKYWAGFYWRNNNYTLEFIEKVCKLCMKTGIAKVSITPWKTFLIKDINAENLVYWEQLIGRMGINMRHSSFELNWHLPVMDESAFYLKKQIVRAFDKIDVRSSGLSFSITEKDQPALYTSIRIIKVPWLKLFRKFALFKYYNVEVAKDFSPNTLEYKIYLERLSKSELIEVLIELSKNYYLRLPLEKLEKEPIQKKRTEIKLQEVYQCSRCYSIYNEQIGDELNNIKPGTSFHNLPADYCCAVCESSMSFFTKKKIAESYLATN